MVLCQQNNIATSCGPDNYRHYFGIFWLMNQKQFASDRIFLRVDNKYLGLLRLLGISSQ